MSVAMIKNVGGSGVDQSLFPDSFSVSTSANNSSSSGNRDLYLSGTIPLFGIYRRGVVTSSHSGTYAGQVGSVTYYKNGSALSTESIDTRVASVPLTIPDCDYAVFSGLRDAAGSQGVAITITFYKE